MSLGSPRLADTGPCDPFSISMSGVWYFRGQKMYRSRQTERITKQTAPIMMPMKAPTGTPATSLESSYVLRAV